MDCETLAAYRKFVVEVRKRAPKTVQEYMRVILVISSKIDLLKVKGHAEIESVVNDLAREHNWGDRYIYKISKIIVPFYRWLLEEGKIEFNPYVYSRYTKPKPERPKFLMEDQYNSLVNDPHLSMQDLALCTLLWETAIRREECSLIRQSDFSFKTDGSAILHIRREVSKGGYGERDLTIPPRSAWAIYKQIQLIKTITAAPVVFLNNARKSLDAEDITERIKKIADRKTLSHDPLEITPKMFRHGRGVVWILSGVPDTVVMRWLGHNSLEMTAHYVNMAASISQQIHKKYLPNEYIMQNTGDAALLSDILDATKFKSSSIKIEAPSELIA